MNSITSNNIKKKLAEKYNLSVNQINEIVKVPFEVASSMITSGDKKNFTFYNIRIPNFGMFLVRRGRLEHFKKIYGDETT